MSLASMDNFVLPVAASAHVVRALVLLAGAVRRSTLSVAVQRPVWQLPVSTGESLLDGWYREARSMADRRANGPLPVRIIVNREAAGAAADVGDVGGEAGRECGRAPMSMEHDPVEFRGTGGVVRDLAREYAEDDYLLVANAAQVLLSPLADLLGLMLQAGGDVVVLASGDGTPSGLFLVRCGAVMGLPAVGFVDLKEQALPLIAKNYRVKVAQLDRPAGLPVRTAADYLGALRRRSILGSGIAAVPSPFSEDCTSAFSVVEEGAQVHPSARLHDSVVLKGARVEADAQAVRCIICPGGILRRGKMAADALVTAPGVGAGR